MPSITQLSLFFSLLALFQLSTSQICYFPDGSPAMSDTPCGTGLNSACCAAGSYCLSNGLCITNMILNRGSCTDPSWTAEECAPYCLDWNPSGGKGFAPCNNHLFACSYKICDQGNFSLPIGNIVARAGQVNVILTATATMPAATACPTSAPALSVASSAYGPPYYGPNYTIPKMLSSLGGGVSSSSPTASTSSAIFLPSPNGGDQVKAIAALRLVPLSVAAAIALAMFT